MNEVKFYDYDVVKQMEGKPQVELVNKSVMIEFDDCKFEVSVYAHENNSIEIRKIEKFASNRDEIKIYPRATNSIVIQ